MTLILNVGKKASASNKPPQPVPTPDPKLYPTKLEFSNHSVWVSVPQPDRLTFSFPIIPETYNEKISKDVPVGEFAAQLKDYFQSEPYNAHHANGHYYPADWKWAQLQMGERDSYVRFEKIKVKNKGVFARVELNPRKLGPQGFKQLALVLGGPHAPFNLPKVLELAEVKRLDICVDVVGLSVTELIVFHKKQGKRSYYVDSSGDLETVYIHRQLPPVVQAVNADGKLKKVKKRREPAGAVMLKVYDRCAERRSVKANPPFGPAPVSRIELSITWFKKWAPLKLLPKIDDRFSQVRVGFIDTQPGQSGATWKNYIALRRTMNAAVAARSVGASKSMAKNFEAAENVIVADIIKSSQTWKGWTSGVEQTGLLTFLLADEQKP